MPRLPSANLPTPPSDGRRFGIVAVFFALAGVVALAMSASMFSGAQQFEGTFYGALSFSMLCIVFVFVSGYRRDFDAMHPLCMAMVFMALLFPFHGYIAHDNYLVLDHLGSERYTLFAEASMVVGIAAIAMWVGFGSGGARWISGRLPRGRFAIEDDHPSILPKLAIAYAVAVIARYFLWVDGLHFHQSGTVQGGGSLIRFQFLLNTFQQFAPLVALFLLASGIKLRNRRYLVGALVLLAIELAWGLSSGSRLKLLMPLFIAVIVVGRVWRPVRLTHLIAGMALFLLVLFPLATSFKVALSNRIGDVQRDGMSTSVLVDTMQDAVNDNEDPSHTTDAKVELFAERMHGLTSLALVMRYTPERHDFLLGEHYLMMPINILVPRFIWPDKPDIAQLIGIFTDQYWEQIRENESSMAVTHLGDFWINFHLPGVLIGSFLFGVFLRYLHGFLDMGGRLGSVYPHVVYALLLPQVVRGMEMVIDGYAAALVKIAIVFLAFAWFLSPRRPTPVPVLSPSEVAA